MATRVKVTLNHFGVAALLRSIPVKGMVDGAAERVAANARSQGHHVRDGSDLPVTVTSYTTDRAAAAVTLAHAAGTAMQAKHGVLTKAAADEGLEVHGGST
jgi:hypothetical protein